MTLPSATLFPQALLPLFIFEPRYRRMLHDALESDRLFAVAMQKPGRLRDAPFPVAGLGLIRASVQHEDQTSHLILQGVARVQLGPAIQYKPYRVHQIQPLAASGTDPVALQPLLKELYEKVGQGLEKGLAATLGQSIPSDRESKEGPLPVFSIQEIIKHLQQMRGPEEVTDLVASALVLDPEQRQRILETLDVSQRLRHLIFCLTAQANGASPKNES